jgi:hypothetical protein
MSRPVGRTHLPKWIGAVHTGFTVRSPTQTNRFRHRNRSTRWRCLNRAAPERPVTQRKTGRVMWHGRALLGLLLVRSWCKLQLALALLHALLRADPSRVVQGKQSKRGSSLIMAAAGTYCRCCCMLTSALARQPCLQARLEIGNILSSRPVHKVISLFRSRGFRGCFTVF